MENINIKRKKVMKISIRDMETFYALSKYHLTGNLLYELSQTFSESFKNVSNTRARLNELYSHGYLKRDERLIKGRSNNENYYFLTKKSASLFYDLLGLHKSSTIFNPVKIGKQAHSFSLSEVMVKIETDIKKFKEENNYQSHLIGYIRENHLALTGQGNRIIKPDGTIFLSIEDQNYLLFLEVDQSTEVVYSTSPNAKSFQRKIEIYSEFKQNFFNHNLIHRVDNLKGYRVITICKSEQRLQNLTNLARNMNKLNMFWFTTKEKIQSKQINCLTESIWTLPNGNDYPLFQTS